MPAQWTGDVVGKMHLAGVRKSDLAKAIGYTPEYLSMILNGHRSPKDAQKTIESALYRLINEHSTINTDR